MRGPDRGVYYDLYVIIDIYSRYVVGWTVAARDDADIAKALIASATQVHGPPDSPAAWAGQDCLRQLLDALPAVDGPLVVDPRRDPTPASRAAVPALRLYEIRARLERFYVLAAEADIPELTRLASDLVASNRGVPDAAGHERPRRGLQPQDQADQARRVLLPKPSAPTSVVSCSTTPRPRRGLFAVERDGRLCTVIVTPRSRRCSA